MTKTVTVEFYLLYDTISEAMCTTLDGFNKNKWEEETGQNKTYGNTLKKSL